MVVKAALLVLCFGTVGARRPDWLIDTIPPPTIVSSEASVALSNGVLRREFITTPAFGTVDLLNMATNESALRHILPEATLTMDGVNYVVGGLFIKDTPSPTGPKFTGQHAFLNRTDLASRLGVLPNAWNYVAHDFSEAQGVDTWNLMPGRLVVDPRQRVQSGHHMEDVSRCASKRRKQRQPTTPH
jgi:hypothetical protein